MLSIPHGRRVDFGLPESPADDPYFAVTVHPRTSQESPVTTYHRVPEGVESPFDWLVALSREYTDFNENLRKQRRASRRAMWSRNDGKVKWCVAAAVVSVIVGAGLIGGVIPGLSLATMSGGVLMSLVTLGILAFLSSVQVYQLIKDATLFDYRDHPLARVPREDGVRVYESPIVPPHNKKRFPKFVIPGEDVTQKVVASEAVCSA